MPKPEFCESLLQQWMNIEIFCLTHQLPIIDSLYNERLCGWDSAYCLPWLGNGLAAHKGCNFFIQYKISNRYDTVRAKEWKNWGKPFFRFNLWHQKNWKRDFTQRDHLIMLANRGFVTIYVTNHILRLSELTMLACQRLLCSKLPVLQINSALSQHEQISFTSDSPCFRLHSSEETIPKKSMLETLKIKGATDLRDDVEKILPILMHYEEVAGIKTSAVKNSLKELNDKKGIQSRALVAWAFLRYYLDVDWLRTIEY